MTMSFACSCGKSHSMTPTALNELVKAFYAGDAQHVTAQGVQATCAVKYLKAN